MKNKILTASIVFFLFFANAFADISIKAEVDKTSITTDDAVTYKVTVTSDEKNLSAPELPTLDDFQVVSSARSSTVSFIKNSPKALLAYVLVLLPRKAGKLIIGPSIVKVNSKAYATDAFTIEVAPGKMKAQVSPEENQIPESSFPQSDQPQTTL